MKNNRLEELRTSIEPRISRSRLGARSGVDPQTIFRIEREGAVPQLATARALTDALAEMLDKELTIDDVFPSPAEVTA